jgi:hypothetical protein
MPDPVVDLIFEELRNACLRPLSATAMSPFLEVLEAPEEKATSDVIIPTPFFPQCRRRLRSLLDHRRGHTLPGLLLEGMLTITLVPHGLTRLCTGYCFRSRRTWCGTLVSIPRILYCYAVCSLLYSDYSNGIVTIYVTLLLQVRMHPMATNSSPDDSGHPTFLSMRSTAPIMFAGFPHISAISAGSSSSSSQDICMSQRVRTRTQEDE